MTAAVYVVGGPGDREDLRYSLRSLINAPVIDEVWVVGDVPTWFTGVKMPLEPLAEKFANQRQSITRFVNAPGVPERFYLFNDDMFIVEPVDDDLPVCKSSRSRLSTWAEMHRESNDGHQWDCHQCHIIDTADWTVEQFGGDPWLYEAHTPLLFDTAKLQRVINAYPVERRFVVGEVYPLAGAGGEGEYYGNAKTKVPASFSKKLSLRMPFLSCSPSTWQAPVGPFIRDLFPGPCDLESTEAVAA